MPCVTSNVESPKVSVFEKYAIKVESIPPSQRNGRDVHHHYLNRLRDTLDTLREIVEEARSKRPSDHSLDYACVYTKWSQELLENCSRSRCSFVGTDTSYLLDGYGVLGKSSLFFFIDQSITYGVSLTWIRRIHQRVSNATKAIRSQSKSNKMNDKTLPANSVPEKKVEDHHRKNKSKLSKNNRVDSSTSVRRTVFNTNSNSLCKTCNECIISFNHDKCVENSLKSSKPSPVRKIWRVKQDKQTWKPTGKVFTTVAYHWKPTGRIFPLVRPTALNRGTMYADPQGNNTPVIQIVLWYLDSGCSKHMTGDRSRLRNFVKKFIGTVKFRNDHFGAIMGYGDYVIGDSVISRVYYVEGLGHNC
ncbi:hypothetical protein Tco_0861638 [Tanacetum coccineum]|uniref:Retrovirus-related Pol polyprotein from transposon TNT 1-94-like beta-barrel domain-containing protein n=1 Tax=Tanacetum coccineum TaxID=301880 RepID=A0ABQ5BLN2_9ASTR